MGAEFDDFRHDIVSSSEISRAQEEEISRRLAEAIADPSILTPFGEIEARQLFKKFANARA